MGRDENGEKKNEEKKKQNKRDCRWSLLLFSIVAFDLVLVRRRYPVVVVLLRRIFPSFLLVFFVSLTLIRGHRSVRSIRRRGGENAKDSGLRWE